MNCEIDGVIKDISKIKNFLIELYEYLILEVDL